MGPGFPNSPKPYRNARFQNAIKETRTVSRLTRCGLAFDADVY